MAPRAKKESGVRSAAAGRLFSWYHANGRDLPWRKTRDPYRIWVSEIMLQQTTVATVLGRYAAFLERFPDVFALAKASEASVLKAWEGLGYYARARNLHAAARLIVRRHGGRFPSRFDEIVAFPGIGRSTAGAIASIAFGARAPILDGNVRRLLGRLLGLEGMKALWDASESLIPRTNPGDFNQALMDLGATVCLPREPLCGPCPLGSFCRSCGTLPAPREARPKRRTAHFLVASVRRERDLLVRRETERKLLAGLWGFPSLEGDARAPLAKEMTLYLARHANLAVRAGRVLGTTRHVFTHIEASYTVREFLRCGTSEGGDLPPPFAWARPSRLKRLPVSTAQRKIEALILSSLEAER